MDPVANSEKMNRYLYFSPSQFKKFIDQGRMKPYLYYMNQNNEIVQVTEVRLIKDKIIYPDEINHGLFKRFITSSDKDIYNLLQIAQKKAKDG